MLALLGPGSQVLLLQGLYPTDHFSLALDTPVCSLFLVASLVQELSKVIIWTHCCPTVTLENISATMACDEHLLNVIVLQSTLF